MEGDIYFGCAAVTSRDQMFTFSRCQPEPTCFIAIRQASATTAGIRPVVETLDDAHPDIQLRRQD
jgi:hypothetical protein